LIIASRLDSLVAGVKRRDNLDRGKLRTALYVEIAVYANPEQSLLRVILDKTCVTRGKVSVCLSDMSRLKGRATPIRKDALYWNTCNVKV
jgi:hypothetical protein